MLRRTKLLMPKRLGRIALAVLLGWMPLIAIAQPGPDTPASLIGRSVETRGGEELGKVRDFAVDLQNGRVRYLVVAIGSFLVDDGLIAIAPQALKLSADGPLILQTDRSRLTGAQRFAADRWPAEAGITGPTEGAGEQAVAGTEVEADRGSATISDGNRTATLSGGEQHIQFAEPPPGSATATPGDATTAANAPAGAIDAREPLSRFDRLDRNGDGLLDRAEIAHELTRDDRFLDIDVDGSGGVDPGEFDRMLSGRGDG